MAGERQEKIGAIFSSIEFTFVSCFCSSVSLREDVAAWKHRFLGYVTTDGSIDVTFIIFSAEKVNYDYKMNWKGTTISS